MPTPAQASRAFLAPLFLLAASLAACSAPSATTDEDVESQEDGLSLAGAAANELSAAIAKQAKKSGAEPTAHGTHLHTCTSKGSRTKVRFEIWVFERSREDYSPGMVIACAKNQRVAVPAKISPASGYGYYWNDDTHFDLGGTSFTISVNDPEDYGYTESASTKQLQLDCTPAPHGWGPFDQ
jgi:hypothetical protein